MNQGIILFDLSDSQIEFKNKNSEFLSQISTQNMQKSELRSLIGIKIIIKVN